MLASPPPPAPRRPWFLLVLVGVLAAALLAGAVVVAVLVLRDGEADGAYRAADDLCGLPEVAALGPRRIEPKGDRRTTEDGRPRVSCSLTLATGEFGSAIVSMSATIEESAERAERFYTSWLDMFAQDKKVTDVPGLGAKASWYDGDGIELVGYDDNLVFQVAWQEKSDPPADVVSRLARLATAVLDACRRPGVSTPATRDLSPLPHLPTPSAPDLAYRKVDDLCQVAKVGKVGTVASQSDTARESGKLVTMTCTARLESASLGQFHQVLVIAVVDTSGKDLADAFATERRNARDARDVPGLGSGAFLQPRYVGGPRLLVYEANLQLSVSYTTADPRTQPRDIADRLADVATATMTGLAS